MKCPGNYMCTGKAVSKADCTFTALSVTYPCRASHQPSMFPVLIVGRSSRLAMTAALALSFFYTD